MAGPGSARRARNFLKRTRARAQPKSIGKKIISIPRLFLEISSTPRDRLYGGPRILSSDPAESRTYPSLGQQEYIAERINPISHSVRELSCRRPATAPAQAQAQHWAKRDFLDSPKIPKKI